jgi:hypothetical protein
MAYDAMLLVDGGKRVETMRTPKEHRPFRSKTESYAIAAAVVLAATIFALFVL